MEFRSRKKLRPWMEEIVISGRFCGVEWLDENEKTFKIPWQRHGRPEWREEENLIFKEWEKVTGRFKEDDEDSWSDWKTRLRCALTKNPEIIEMHDLHSKDKSNPYKVYKFLDASVAFTSEPLSENGTFAVSKSSPQSQCSPGPRYNDLGNGNRHMDGTKHRFAGNVPTVVTDSESDSMSENIFNEPATSKSASTQEDIVILVPVYFGHEDCKLPVLDGNVQFAHEGQVSVQTDWTPGPTPQNHLPLNIKPELSQMCYEQLCHNQEEEMVQQEPSTDEVNLPSDLESIEINDLLMGASPPANLSTPKTSLEAGAANTRTKKGVFQVRIFYLKDVIVEGIIGDEGCRIFYDTSREILHNTAVEEDMFGPKTAQEIELPEVKSNVGEEKKRLINNLLNRMDRGVVLQVVDGDIYAKRLCGTRVFVSDGSSTSEVLDRRNKASVKIFDFNGRFKSAMQASAGSRNYRHLQPYVYLTFGQEIKIGQPNPMDRVLVHMQIIHLGAAESVREMPDIREDTQELQISTFDTMDKFLQGFKNMAIKK